MCVPSSRSSPSPSRSALPCLELNLASRSPPVSRPSCCMPYLSFANSHQSCAEPAVQGNQEMRARIAGQTISKEDVLRMNAER